MLEDVAVNVRELDISGLRYPSDPQTIPQSLSGLASPVYRIVEDDNNYSVTHQRPCNHIACMRA